MCYYRLNLLRDAEKQLVSSLKDMDTVYTSLLLAKIYIRLDQPQNALDCYRAALVQLTNTSLGQHYSTRNPGIRYTIVIMVVS